MRDDIQEKKLSTADFVAAADRERKQEQTEAGAGAARATEPATGEHDSLFAADEGQRYRAQWTEIQTAFVDEPRRAVENADSLVAETIQRLAQIFAGERASLEQQWSRGNDRVSTEDLRLALRRYRSFFDRLLSV